MRISDWSSDVCSSDLGKIHHGRRRFRFALRAHITSRRYARLAAQILGETLRTFQLCCLLARAEDRHVRSTMAVGKTVDQRCFRTDNDAANRWEERRLGKGCVSTGCTRGTPYTENKKQKKK